MQRYTTSHNYTTDDSGVITLPDFTQAGIDGLMTTAARILADEIATWDTAQPVEGQEIEYVSRWYEFNQVSRSWQWKVR